MTNTIAIVVAMDKELALLKPLIKDPMTVTINNFDFLEGAIGARQVVVGRCGIGKVNAAVGALTLIDTFHPAMVINTGVAGGTGAGDDPAGVMDLVMASEVAYHDVWCGPGTDYGVAAGCPGRFVCPLGEDVAAAIGARRGLVASGDRFIDSAADVAAVLAHYPEAMAVDMESAAIAQVCHLKSVPFVCLRVVSDTPGAEGNGKLYEEFWTDAPARTFEAVEHLLNIL
ncbi:MAG: 5'-methylthioadenosine/S-adenosylhomocysteine nucleosidase [Muribaculaceae bacterium]|nr:5'-methylthioadenosine/S-adenosylhomocysteine nucleosidase [Muribaculaceae bacterium]